MKITGIDHVYLTVSDMQRSEAFYDHVFGALGFRKGDKTIDGEHHAHYFIPTFQVTIRPARHREPAHDRYAPGLHHVCLQVATAADVDEIHAKLTDLGVAASMPRRYPDYHPEYYATFFDDPDGMRFEVVVRTAHRDEIAKRWKDLTVFLNPLADLHRRERGE